MLVLTIGFSSLSLLLGINFFLKYTNSLSHYSQGKHYARVMDYQGRPIRMSFEYPLEGSTQSESIVTEIHEIFHYGADYFLRGVSPTSKGSRLYKINNLTKLKFEAQDTEIENLKSLLYTSSSANKGNVNVHANAKARYMPIALFLKGSQPGPIGNLIRSTIHGSASRAA